MPRDTRYRFRGAMAPGAVARLPLIAQVPEPDVTSTPGVATMRLYDVIDSWGDIWGVSAKEFVAALDTVPDGTTEIRLHVNSPGGEVFEAITIMNALRNHAAKVVVIVDGLAASAASFIAAGADELVMGRNTELMIHDAAGICLGNASDMHQLGNLLDHLSDNIASVYAEKAGGTVEQWREAMLAETWYSAEEAVAAGLANSVETVEDAPTNDFDLTQFQFAGRAAAPAPKALTPDPTALTSDPPISPAVDEQSAPSQRQQVRHRMNARKSRVA